MGRVPLAGVFVRHVHRVGHAASRRVLAALLVVLVVLACVSPAAQAQLSLPGLGGSSGDSASTEAAAEDPLKAEIDEAQQELDRVRGEISRFNEEVDGIDGTIEQIRGQLADNADLAGVSSIVLDDLSRSELDALIAEQRQRIGEHRARLVELDTRLNDLIQAPARLTAQRDALAGEGSSTRSTGIVAATSHADSGSEGSPAVSAEDPAETLRYLRHQVREARLALTRLRLANNEKLNALTTAQREYERRELAQREAFVDQAINQLAQVRDREAAESLRDARESQRQAAFEPQVVRELTREIVALKEELAAVSHRNGAVAEQLQQVSSRFDRIRDDFVTARDRVAVVGSTPAIGRMLRRRLDALPSDTGYQRASRTRRDEISEVIDRQIDIDEQLRDFGAVDQQVEEIIIRVSEPVPSEEVEPLRQRIGALLVDKRSTLSELYAQYGSVAARLTQLDQAQRDLVRQSEAFVQFIEGKLMTIPSQQPLHDVSGQAWLAALATLFQAGTWLTLIDDTVAVLLGNLEWLVLVVLVAGGVFLSQPFARRRIRSIAPLTRKIRTDSMMLTFATLGCTVLLASFLPVLLGGIGLLLDRAAVSDLSLALGDALIRVAVVLALFGFVRQMVRTDGLAMRHFRWTEASCRRIALNLHWFIPLFAACALVNRFTFYAGVGGWNLFSRLGLLVSLTLAVVFFWRVVLRADVASRFADAQTQMSDPLATRRSRWFYPMILVVGVVMVMSYLGYHYTAMRLDYYTALTVVLLVVLLLAHNLLLRWSTLVQRRLRFNELLKRREEARNSRDAEETPAHDMSEYTAEEEDLDVVGLGEQARRVLTAGLVFAGAVGMYLIWDELFPALRALDEIQLPFTHLVTSDGVESRVPVTLTDLGVSLLVFAATFIGARNLPGLLEFVVLQRLPIDAGARYATITIARYLIVAVGVITGFGIIGADWSKLQWLIAALGVGLGFGLQEIVANFVSGIILLFERPIRVGDVITLGDTDGVVTRIRIRATTIRNWDQKELVVPNKEFITGRLLNWTLSDQVNRMVINVGVAYGSDVDRAMKIMLEAATRHPNVLDEPRPVAVFEGFGDSALNLSLRCYQSGLEWRLVALSDINAEINRRFAEAGIEIPFPQRDVNLRARGPFPVNLDGLRDAEDKPGA